jgi:hypothetical protein
MKKETNFTEMSILLATLNPYSQDPLFPDPPQVRAEDIWPDSTIEWLNKEKEK